MSIHHTRRNSVLTVVVVLIAGFLFGLGAASPAGAHSDKGSIVIINKEPAGPLGIRYVVQVTFVSDGHRASEATATLVAESEGQSLGPLPLTPVADKTGDYEVTAVFPASGAWNVRFTSLEPTAVLEITEYLGLTPDAAAPTTTSFVGAESPVSAPIATEPAGQPVSDQATESISSSKKDSGPSWVVGLLGLGVLAGGAVAFRRRTRSGNKS